jgi:hypothetical protein
LTYKGNKQAINLINRMKQSRLMQRTRYTKVEPRFWMSAFY